MNCQILNFKSLILTVIVCGFNVSQTAQAQTDQDEYRQESPSESDSESPPSLDELLGIDDEVGRDAADAAGKESEDELQRELNEASITSDFVLAIEKMKLSAERLDVEFDSGLGTQRIQEDIIARLEHLIDQAQQMSMMMSSSSGSQSQSQQQSAQKQSPGKKQQQQKQSQSEAQRSKQSQDSQEGDPPPFQDGDINTVMEETRSEWGNLPERIRDQFLQGRYGDKFSSLYQRLTEEYYKRLAEENTP